MYQPVHKQKEKVVNKVSTGELLLGREIVPTSYTTFNVDHQTNSITETNNKVCAREIPIVDIRKRLLHKHEQLGIIRNYPDTYFASLTREECCTKLWELNENTTQTMTDQELQLKLQAISRTRNFKLWHDHSDIAGHSHFLTMVSPVYDPGFYFTSQEMKQKGIVIDVPTVVESPEVHIIARSNSSLHDQRMFNDSRRKSILDFNDTIFNSSGILVQDRVRFFHGDGPAAQFEAGNKIGGYYCCVGCDTRSTRFQDLAHCFRASHITLQNRQQFLLEGDAWKHNQFDPLEKLKIDDLRRELNKRKIPTNSKKKPQLQAELQEIQKGIANFPALTKDTPPEDLGLERYEIFSTEPLHDIKGHFSNVITEVMKTAPLKTKEEIDKINNTILKKSTLRASDYRKAFILIYNNLQKCQVADKQYTELFRTAVEICELFYAQDSHRSAASILRLHNVTFIHAKLCKELFGNTQTTSFFGRYFHSIVTHSPLLYRIIALRSVNTEMRKSVYSAS